MNAPILNRVDYTQYDTVYSDIAKHFGTPTFAFDLELFSKRIAEFKQVLNCTFGKLGIDTEVAYAGKAFLTRRIAELVDKNALSVDTCSLLESKTALSAGAPGSSIGLHGNNKSDAELELAVDEDFARIILDSSEEIGRVAKIARRKQKRASVFLRITTGVHAGGHEYISTAHEDQKFGVSLASGEALEALKSILKYPELDLRGVHAHIGSQIAAAEGFIESAKKLLTLRSALFEETGYLLPELDLGGGFGIQYVDTDPVLDLPTLFEKLAIEVLEHCTINNAETLPRISFEPGRWLIGPCMSTLYTVGSIKNVPLDNGECRRYVAVDGGMADNIRPALYQAKYTCYAIKRLENEPVNETRVVGKHCETGDVLVQSAELPVGLKRGDLLVIPTTGAYGYSMASNYNMLAKPPVIAFSNGEYEVVIPRQNDDQVIL